MYLVAARLPSLRVRGMAVAVRGVPCDCSHLKVLPILCRTFYLEATLARSELDASLEEL